MQPRSNQTGGNTAGAAVIEADLGLTDAHIVLRFPSWTEIPAWPLPDLRGLLGHSLPREDAEVKQAVFQPPQGLPHPLILDCPSLARETLALHVRLRFFGSGAAWMRPCLDAFRHPSRKSFAGNASYALEFEGVRSPAAPWSAGWEPTGHGTFMVELTTPAILQFEQRPLQPGGPILEAIVSSARRRLAGNAPNRSVGTQRERGLAECYGTLLRRPSDEELSRLFESARIVQTTIDWVTLERVSSRSGQVKPLSGWTGWFVVENVHPELERLLRVAEAVGVGKMVFHGAGRIRVRPVHD